MSIQAVGQVLEHSRAKGTAKLVLVVLANRINPETGVCWPSVRLIAGEVGISERHVQRILGNLVASGELIVKHRTQEGVYTSSLYSLPELSMSPVTPMSPPGDTHVTTPGDVHVTTLVTPVSPETKVNLKDETKGKRKDSADAPAKAAPRFFDHSEQVQDPGSVTRDTSVTAPAEPGVPDHLENKGHTRAKPPAKAAPRLSDHPAIQAFRAATGRYPPKLTFPRVIDCLGNEPDIERLREAAAEWSFRGFNPQNSEGVLEWYRDGIPIRAVPGANGNGQVSKSDLIAQRNREILQRAMARAEAEDG